MSFNFRRAVACAVTAGLLSASVGTASADIIANKLDGSVDAEAEVMALNVGGASVTTQLYLIETNNDGKRGCNIQGGERLVLSVQSSNTSVATVTPSSVTFASCSDTPTLTVSAVGQGTATVAIGQTSNDTGATFDLAPAKFDVKVAAPAPSNTAPSITVDGVTAGAPYNKGSVPAATCVVTDAEDGGSSFAATLSAITGPYASDDIGQQTASCSYTDRGTPPLTATASKTYNIIDPTAPSISHVLNPAAPDGDNGWYKSNVSLAWTVTENESPKSLQKTGCVDQNVIADQVATKYSCSASSAGGSTGAEVTIKRDATPPTVGLAGGPADGATYYLGLDAIPAAPTCSASDATSDIANCAVTGYRTDVGTHTVEANATDNAGNGATSSSITYTVANLTLNGFYQPVNMGNVLNTVKGGSTVPLKFEVFAGSTELTATSIVDSFKTRSIACDSGAAIDDVEFTTTGSTSLRYDATGGQFVQNWATPKSPGTCVRVTLTLKPGALQGQAISADFKLR